MRSSFLNSMDSRKYFDILLDLVAGEPEFAVCSADGALISSSQEVSSFSTTRKSGFVTDEFREIPDVSRTMFRFDPGKGDVLYRANMTMPSGEELGSLYAIVSASGSASGNDCGEPQEHILAHALDAVACLIEKECQLEAELDSMAEELTVRYEELNLVYASEDEISSFEHEGEALNRLITHCLEHLNLEVVSLLLPGQDRIFCVTSRITHINDAHDTVRGLQNTLLPWFNSDNDSLILNAVTDPNRKTLNIDLPYKLLACSVRNYQGRLLGSLLCLNPADAKDFLNSDRNLLQVVARKISKILQTNYDPLTGLMNRRALEALVRKSLDTARSEGIYCCLLYVDLDQLEVVNEVHGREAGDCIIQESAKLLQKKLRTADSFGYLGDGKYGVLLEHCDLTQGAKVAENIRHLVEHTGHEWAGQTIDLSITIGVSLIDPHSKDVGTILEAAEIALRSAKEQGRNKIQIYHQADDELTARKKQMSWVNRVQTALREDQFRLYAQSIRPVQKSEENYHFEVLLRMLEKDGSVIGCFKFIPAAEQYGLMPQLDRWVIDATFSALAEREFAKTSGEGVVSINLSGQSLSDENLLSYIKSRMAQHGIEPGCICFEITETAAIYKLADAHQFLRDLKELGCYLSLDDFGTGLSSFTYLQTLPVDILKIDGSFVRNILTDKVSHAMVSSINQIGHVMELKTVAEFVENDSIRRELEKIGVDYLQGYGIDEPSPLETYLDAIKLKTHTSTG